MDGYSVFDVYADKSIKERMSQIIRNGAQQYNFLVTDNMRPTLEANEPDRFIDERPPKGPMQENTIYYCIAVAYHTSSTPVTGDSFAAVPNVQIPDDKTPELDDVSGSITTTDNKKFSGSINLRFSKDLYWKEKMESTSATAVTGTTLLTHAGTNIETSKLTPTGSGTFFSIKYSGLEPGDTIELFGDGFICNQSGTGTRDKVSITLMDGYTNPGTGLNVRSVYVEIKWGGTVKGQIVYKP